MNKMNIETNTKSRQLITFCVDNEIFAIDLMRVQEVTGRPVVLDVPLAPTFVRGLVNLRGQIATAVDLSDFFRESSKEQTEGSTEVNATPKEEMSVICEINRSLIALIVDSIGDVIEVREDEFEAPPPTLTGKLNEVVSGIYRQEEKYISVIDLVIIENEIEPTEKIA
jgi:purine-binding chemotaxis protein CheW